MNSLVRVPPLATRLQHPKRGHGPSPRLLRSSPSRNTLHLGKQFRSHAPRTRVPVVLSQDAGNHRRSRSSLPTPFLVPLPALLLIHLVLASSRPHAASLHCQSSRMFPLALTIASVPQPNSLRTSLSTSGYQIIVRRSLSPSPFRIKRTSHSSPLYLTGWECIHCTIAPRSLHTLILVVVLQSLSRVTRHQTYLGDWLISDLL